MEQFSSQATFHIRTPSPRIACFEHLISFDKGFSLTTDVRLSFAIGRTQTEIVLGQRVPTRISDMAIPPEASGQAARDVRSPLPRGQRTKAAIGSYVQH